MLATRVDALGVVIARRRARGAAVRRVRRFERVRRAASEPAPRRRRRPTAALPDVEPTAADFVNINTMTRVGDHFVGSLNGHLDDALAVARNPGGGVYPVGTIIQLVPTEAMVKRRAGYSPSTSDWEFFSLERVADRDEDPELRAEVVKNFLGGDCASCHSRGRRAVRLRCGKNHGCAPLPLTDELIARIQGRILALGGEDVGSPPRQRRVIVRRTERREKFSAESSNAKRLVQANYLQVRYWTRRRSSAKKRVLLSLGRGIRVQYTGGRE